MGRAWIKFGRLCGTWRGRRLVLSTRQPDLDGPHVTVDAIANFYENENRKREIISLGRLDGYYQFRYISGATKPVNQYRWNQWEGDVIHLVQVGGYLNPIFPMQWVRINMVGYRERGWALLEDCERDNFLNASPVRLFDGGAEVFIYYSDTIDADDNAGASVYHVFHVP